ncbi:major facilitator superfamily domain-containing protein [Phascolomyces articulosus]|uniref:Major facilitator superfamily domain-containing protein n=1 Tax=Phascolomyces articulosus TaxID=60185 RepID=A0AAD5K2B9_9FUNG|nr:major facilitator superfamily domain-containing protein [Phascolomyces articulosus]
MASATKEEEKVQVPPGSLIDVPSTEEIEANSNELKKNETLTPPDGGRGWLVIMGSFLGLFSIFGYNYSWGVFLRQYKTIYSGQMAQLSWIGSICVALFFILGPINQLVIKRMGYRNMLMTGAVLCTAALILASFAKQVWHLFLTQGLLFGFGASFVWFPCIGAPQQWFNQHRGLAVGLAMSGSGIGGLVVSNICQAAIDNVGYRWALRIVGIMCFVLIGIASLLVRPFGTIQQTGGSAKGFISWYLFKNPKFTILFMHGLITTFGYMTPFFLLPSHAQDLKLDPWVGTNLSAIMSAVNAGARICTGYMGDKLGRFNSLFICTLLAGVCCLAIWINATNEATIWVFSVLYGFFGGGYVALFPTVQPQVVGLENIAPAVGLLYFTNLFGYMFGTPIASAIINKFDPPDYRYAAVWAGCMVIGGALFAGWLRVTQAGFKLVRV